MHHRFVDDGSGPVVVLLHGAIPDGRVFESLVRALRGDHRVLVPTYPGYGGAAPAPTALSMAEHVETLIDDLAELGVTSCGIVGCSAGGYRALLVALSARVEVTSVVVLSGFAELPAEHRASLRQAASALRGGAGADLALAVAPTMFAPRFAASYPERVAGIAAQLLEVPAETLAAELEASAESEDLRARLGELRMPVVIRTGDADVAMPKERSEVLAAAVARAKLQVVEGAGHSLLEEDGDATIASVVRALAHGKDRSEDRT